MIKINLLGDQKSSRSTHFLFMAGYTGSLAAVLISFFFMYTSAAAKVSELATEKAGLDAELATLQTTNKDVKDLEKMRQELNDKLVVIARLKKSKLGPVRVLDDLNVAIPDRSWVTDIKETAGLMKISGLALDNQTIASFMQKLDASDYFDAVDLKETKQIEDRGANVYSFTLQTKVNYAGKIHLQKNEQVQVPEKGPETVNPTDASGQG